MTDAYGQNQWPFSWAIMSLFLWLVPHMSIEIGEYHRALHKSTLWSTEEFQTTGRRAIRHAAHMANLIAVLLIVGAACGVALNTKNLDGRMHSIIFGLSFIMGAAVIFAITWRFPEWLEVYNVRRRRDVLPVTRSLWALKFNVMWSILAQYFEVYFLLLPFYCGVGPAVVPVSAVVGIFIGVIIDLCVYWSRTRVNMTHRRGLVLVFAMIFVALICSGILFSEGCQYINEVWGSSEDSAKLAVGLGTFFAWLVAGLVIHYFFWRTTKGAAEKLRPSNKIQPGKSFKYKNAIGEVIVEEGPGKIDSATQKAKTELNSATQMAMGAVHTLSSGRDEEVPVTASTPIQDVVPEDNDASKSKDMDSPPNDDEVQEEMEQQLESTVESIVSNEDIVQENAVHPTYGSLLKSKCCCCCCCFGGPPAQCCAGKTRGEKVYSFCRWTIWIALSGFSLYFIVVNLGATYQQDVVRTNLPHVKEILYKNMNFIEVCAYDGDGSTGSLNAASIIKAFPSKDAAHAAGYKILHCGPCAACSTWPNIKYEFTTRDFLAAESKKCGTKSIFGGADAVQTCLEGPPIHWQGECALCWTVDIVCSKKYCAFNYLQSVMINTMTNFEVGMDSITAATCEEANCEAFPYPNNFVECSGATRRRMNVTSMIARPEDETCAIVDVSWETLFPGE